jgi:hypothetical protein
MADGDLAPVVSLDTVRARRRPRVRTTRIPAERGAGVVILTDAELDDELAAHALDLRSELEALLARSIPATPEGRALYLSQLASRLAHAALDAAETDPAYADARESYHDDIDALLARLCAVWGSL